jgi:D-alanyl-lipoteichoic acid acyltransferase DltB (MBOAT superfamily)
VTFGKAMLATIVTMTIAGLWHGSAWTYVVFGLVHGLALVVNHLSRRRRWPMPAPFGWLLTTLFLIVAFVIFRAPSIEEAASFLSAMGGRHGVSGLEVFAELSRPEQGQVALLTIASLTVTYWPSALPKAPKRSLAAAMVAALLLVLSAVFINSGIPRGFIYRDF